MKICHIIETGGGGSGRTTLFIVEYLISQGHDVTLIYSPTRAEKAFIDAINAISGLQAIPLTMHRSIGFHDAVTVFNLYRALRKYGPFDVIHSHSSKAGGFARLAGLFIPGSVQIYTPHAFVTMDPTAPWIYGVLEWMLSWLCTTIIAVSSNEGEHASRHLHILRSKIKVVPNGAAMDQPASRSEARATLGFAEDDIVIGFVGRLAPQKRPERAIEAFSQLVPAHPALRLAIVGNGMLDDETRAHVTILGVEANVRFFVGYDARKLMPGFNMLLCSSDYEGFANIFLEALAEAVPIVTTPVGGSDEAVIPNKTGFVTKGYSPQELAAAMEKVLQASSSEKARWAAFTEIHRQEFTVQRMCEHTLDVYHASLPVTSREPSQAL